MDLAFTPAELGFRDEMRAVFRSAVPSAIRDRNARGEHLSKDDIIASHRALNAAGLAVPHWPLEWGGRAWSAVQRLIYSEEMFLASVPPPLPFNVAMVGPVIATFGSEAQKRRFLPRAANLDDWWCQGFSEPGAGSDLASLKTTAVRQGDQFIVSGAKTWTTLAQHADWIFCLVRTDKTARKQQGISFLLIDMTSPGITVRPIITIDGGHEVNEVFFDDVRVPAENLVGEENKGWDYAKFLLGNERTGIARVGLSRQRVQRIKQLAAETPSGDGVVWDDAGFRERVVLAEVQLKALELTQLRVVAAQRGRAADKPDPRSSILKIKGSELQQTTTELLLDLAGPFAAPLREAGLGNEPPDALDWAATAAPTYFNWRKVSIYGGSNEIQRNIIAKAILGF